MSASLIPICAQLGVALLLFSQPVEAQVVAPAGPASRVATSDVYRINCGGAQYQDPQGKIWSADFGFNTGNAGSSTNPIANTDKDPLYQTNREDPGSAPELRYRLQVTPFAQYRVELHFAETSPAITGPGQRVFDVAIGGVTQLSGFDPFAEAGTADTAVVKVFDVIASNARLDIDFTHLIGDPEIEAIHVSWTGTGIVNFPPVITSLPPTVATENKPYFYNLDATDANPGDVRTYSMLVAPAGASIDQNSGLIHWTPLLQIGLQDFVVRATDIGGRFDEQSFVVDTRYRINCGSSTPYTGAGGEAWTTDFGYNTGNTFSTSQPIAGTTDPELYQSERNDLPAVPELLYSLNVVNGDYVVRLHFAEIFDQISGTGQRVFDVNIEGVPRLLGYDIFGAAGESFTATHEDLAVTVSDGVLDVEFLHVIENSKISAIEVFESGQLSASPPALAWGHVGLGMQGGTLNILLDNSGALPIEINDLTFRIQSGIAGHDYEVNLDGVLYIGDHATVSYPVNVSIDVGQSLVVPVIFRPTESTTTVIDLEFSGNFVTQTVELSGIGGDGFGFLHVVIVAPDVTVDFDGDGSEEVNLNGSDSHTHEPGETIISFEWKENNVPFSTQAELTRSFPVAQHSVELTIGDSAQPQKFASATRIFDVVPIQLVPGVLVLTYDAMGGNSAGLLNNLPSGPDHASESDGFALLNLETASENVMVRFLAAVDIQTAGSYEFFPNYGGSATLLFIDNVQAIGPTALSVGTHLLDVRFAVNSALELPLEVLVSEGGGASMPIDCALLTHDLSSFAPVINEMVTVHGPRVARTVPFRRLEEHAFQTSGTERT